MKIFMWTRKGHQFHCCAGRCLSVDRFAITLDAAGLEARLKVKPGTSATTDQLRSWLASEGIVFGLDQDAIQEIGIGLEKPDFKIDVVVARGLAQVDGTDGELRGKMLAGPLPGKVGKLQRIDYRERCTLHPVSIGDRVAEIIAPTEGTSGKDVKGQELSATPGRPHPQKFGPGVRVEAEHLMAEIDGVVLATEVTMDVVKLYVHEGDVDYGSGNLHTNGSLAIGGSVNTGFCATATGDVTVAGDVQGGSVTVSGSVHVAHAILGCHDVIRAGADITCHHTAASRLAADRSIAVSDQVHEATLQAPDIVVHGDRGIVRGAKLQARDHIHVATAGSPGGAETVLAVAQLLDERVDHARHTVRSSRFDRMATRAGRGKAMRAAVRASDEERAEMIRLRKRQKELMASATIYVEGTCHEGVVIRFGSAELRPNLDLHGVTFRWDADEVAIRYGEDE